MTPAVGDLAVTQPPGHIHVLLDGRVIGHVAPELEQAFVDSLRYLKITQETLPQFPAAFVQQDLEIGHVARRAIVPNKSTQFPGIYLNSNIGRFLRPVKHLRLDQVEWIGPFEQVHLSIACMEEDIRSDSEYQEISSAFFLSVLPSNIPFLNYNQSPRNMYQCQMAKQTMGTALHNLPYRFDNRVYRLMNPQIPLVKGILLNDFHFFQVIYVVVELQTCCLKSHSFSKQANYKQPILFSKNQKLFYYLH